jgi:hypothetical protein
MGLAVSIFLRPFHNIARQPKTTTDALFFFTISFLSCFFEAKLESFAVCVIFRHYSSKFVNKRQKKSIKVKGKSIIRRHKTEQSREKCLVYTFLGIPELTCRF